MSVKEFLADYKAKHLRIQEDLDKIKCGKIKPEPIGSNGFRYTTEILGIEDKLYYHPYVEINEAELQKALDYVKEHEDLSNQIELLQGHLDQIDIDWANRYVAKLRTSFLPEYP